jgi:hypothetical protein
LGVVHGDDGNDYPFHCTQIADDSRQVDVDAPVEFVVAAGGGGRWEATTIVKLR